jgi:AraC-like DNA-binding protein
MDNLYLIGTIQTVFLALLVITKKQKKLSDLFLVAFILTMGLRLFSNYLEYSGLSESYRQITLIEFAYWPLFGPLLYLYICTITSENQKFRLVYLVHFIPAITVWLSYSGYIFQSSSLPLNQYKPGGIFIDIGYYVWLFTTHFYFLLSIIKLHIYRRKVKHYFSQMKDVDLRWLMILTYGFGIFLFFSLFLLLTNGYLNIDLPEYYSHIKWFIMVVYIFGLGYYGYKQRGIFSDTESQSIKVGSDINNNAYNVAENKPVEKYAKSKLDDTESKNILNVLLSYMETEKPYTDDQINIKTLSEKTGFPIHKLSQVINTELNKNFYEFVNEYRVKEVKARLKNPEYEQEKIMSIAYDCGFYSKSSFFAVFKKYTNQTPAQYRASK